MKILMTNSYSDGHESSREITLTIPEPDPADLDVVRERTRAAGDVDECDWWDAQLYDYTGDGHGDGSHGKLGFCYSAEIVEADNPELVGREYEWAGY